MCSNDNKNKMVKSQIFADIFVFFFSENELICSRCFGLEQKVIVVTSPFQLSVKGSFS